jgi:hypothetical protein
MFKYQKDRCLDSAYWIPGTKIEYQLIKDPFFCTGTSLQPLFYRRSTMLWTIFVILLILWALGLLTGYTMGGVIHALLVIAIIVILIQVIQGRRRV